MPENIVDASVQELSEFIRWAYYDCSYEIADALNTMPIDLDEICRFLSSPHKFQHEWEVYREFIMKNKA